ncbi:caspase family protein [Saccharothrix sp. S26]|uniref:caspase family protein n=1 Tax=Saccharothrix sp. S26 TaxID=2907215 RepID=UPI001F2183A8|nr:caspase family protein [Saccharothrix sp. S26]MCE6998012.1 caspase family protein [Saccharothrix sp. S26]
MEVAMARQVAIGIGVSRVDRLPVLQGVESGVADFFRWARDQGFEVHSFTDSDGRLVTTDDLKRYVEELVTTRDVQKLFVFFAGHGVSTDLVEDNWLLSRAGTNHDEAISVARSAEYARNCGIPHVAFFGDACRTPPVGFQLGMRGATIFPYLAVRNGVRVRVDRFFATRPGERAFEQVPDDVRSEAFGIFSRLLVAALEGRVPEVVTPIDDGKLPFAVQAHPLGEYLDEQVPRESYRLLAVQQTPDYRAESAWSPHVISWLPGPGQPPAVGVPSAARPSRRGGTTGSRPPDMSQADDDTLSRFLEEERGRRLDETFDRIRNVVLGSSGLAGLTVVGGTASRVLVTGGRADVAEEPEGWHIAGPQHGSATALIEIERADRASDWLAAALFPGLSGTAVLGPHGVEQLIYSPVFAEHDTVPEPPHSIVMALALFEEGMFSPDDKDVQSAVFDRFDPVVAVLTAVEYARRGRPDLVLDLIDHFVNGGRVVPYDLVLFAGQDLDDLHIPVVPDFPMTTRGWVLAETALVGEKAFKAARPYLTPSLWTAFSAAPLPVMQALVGQVETEAGAVDHFRA